MRAGCICIPNGEDECVRENCDCHAKLAKPSTSEVQEGGDEPSFMSSALCNCDLLPNEHEVCEHPDGRPTAAPIDVLPPLDDFDPLCCIHGVFNRSVCLECTPELAAPLNVVPSKYPSRDSFLQACVEECNRQRIAALKRVAELEKYGEMYIKLVSRCNDAEGTVVDLRARVAELEARISIAETGGISYVEWRSMADRAEAAEAKNAELVADRAALAVVKRAFELSIVDRKVDQRFENECKEYDYWMEKASIPAPVSEEGR